MLMGFAMVPRPYLPPLMCVRLKPQLVHCPMAGLLSCASFIVMWHRYVTVKDALDDNPAIVTSIQCRS